jgi:hypothetical protein
MPRVRKKSYNSVVEFNAESASINEENLNLFFNMIYDRQMIWKRRFIDKAPAPWTDNEIFKKYKFCNLYREHDRSSQWEIRNIIMDNALTDKNLLWKILVYRTFNNPETFARALNKWPNGIPDYGMYDESEFTAHIKEIKDMGLNPFTNAYSISGNIVRGVTIDEAYCHTVIPTIHKSVDTIYTILKDAIDPEQIITYLMTLPGSSSFIAHEYYQDLTYVPIYSDRSLMNFGQNDYTNLGPGSSQGVRLIFTRLRGIEQLSSYYYLQDIAEEKLEEIGLEKGELMPYVTWNKETHKYEIITESNLSLNQIEGALCEFSKYIRILRNTGRPRCPEFEPRTSTIIVEREENNQQEFITDDDDFISGRNHARRTKALDDFACPPSRRGRPKGSLNKKTLAYKDDTNLSVNLNLTLDLQNVEVLINKVKELWDK